MRSIEKTEAIVLRSMKYLESSKIVTLYTFEHGKMSAIAKGARQRKSRFGATLEPLSYCSAVIYRNDGRNLQILGECDLLHSFHKIGEDLDCMAAGLAVIELTNLVTHEEEKNPALFRLLLNTLRYLDSKPVTTSLVLCHYELHLASVLGFHPSFDECAGCGKDIEEHGQTATGVRIQMESGVCLYGECARKSSVGYQLSGTAFQLLRTLLHSPDPAALEQVAVDSKTENEIRNFLWAYIQYHIPGIKTLKSQKIFSALLQPT